MDLLAQLLQCGRALGRPVPHRHRHRARPVRVDPGDLRVYQDSDEFLGAAGAEDDDDDDQPLVAEASPGM